MSVIVQETPSSTVVSPDATGTVVLAPDGSPALVELTEASVVVVTPDGAVTGVAQSDSHLVVVEGSSTDVVGTEAVATPVGVATDGRPGRDGVDGEPGPPGPPGPPGVSGGAFTFQQTTPADIWDVVHPLGFIPNVSVVDSAGTQVFGDVRIVSPDHIQIRFSAQFAGSAYLS